MITYRQTIQVAGIRSLDEARMLLAAGVDVLGFPLRLDVHTQDMSEGETAEVVQALGTPEKCLVITYEEDPEEVARLCRLCGAGGVQLHGNISVGNVARLVVVAPDLTLVKSLVVGRSSQEELLKRMHAFAPHVHAFITDTFDPATGASGATGRTHDWSVDHSLVKASPRPVILAGGLTPGNVARAVTVVRPAGVDAHTGLEDPWGWKDPDMIRIFVSSARQAFAALSSSDQLRQ